MNGVQAGMVNDDIAVVAVEDRTVIVTGDIEAVVVIVNHVKKKDIVVVTVSTVVVKVVVDIVAVAVAVKVVISHTAVHTKTGDGTVMVVVVIRTVDQGRIEMTVDPSANTDLMGKEQTMNAGPVGMERTVVQRTREPGIAMESGHPTMSVGVTAITARPQQIPRVLVLQLSVFAVRGRGHMAAQCPTPSRYARENARARSVQDESASAISEAPPQTVLSEDSQPKQSVS